MTSSGKNDNPLFAAIAMGAILVLAMSGTVATAMFTANIANANNTVSTATQLLTAKDAGANTLCSSVPVTTSIPSTNTFPCSGSMLPSTVPETGQDYGSVVLTATGTAPAQAIQYTVSSCGPAMLMNVARTTNPLLSRYGLSYQSVGPPSLSNTSPANDSKAISLDGTAGQAIGTVPEASPQVFTTGIWFKTTQGGGGLFGFSNTPDGSNMLQNDRNLFIDLAGHLTFYTWPNSPSTVASTKTYLDGNWHFAVATFDASTGTTVQSAYVDGQLVATTSYATSATGSAVYPGYWNIGKSYRVNSGFFTGSLSNAAVWPAAFTQPKIAALYATSTQDAFSAAVFASSPTNYWPLSDNGLQTFSGPYPVIGTSSPCAHVLVAPETANCIYPAHVNVCGSFTANYTLQSLAAAGSLQMSLPIPGTPQTLNTFLTRNNTYSPFDMGLQLVVNSNIRMSKFEQNFVWANNRVVI